MNSVSSLSVLEIFWFYSDLAMNSEGLVIAVTAAFSLASVLRAFPSASSIASCFATSSAFANLICSSLSSFFAYQSKRRRTTACYSWLLLLRDRRFGVAGSGDGWCDTWCLFSMHVDFLAAEAPRYAPSAIFFSTIFLEFSESSICLCFFNIRVSSTALAISVDIIYSSFLAFISTPLL